MINDDEDEKNLDNFYPNSVLSQTSTTKNNQVPFNTDIDTITTPENQYHYLCRECHKFPLIDFCKDIKYIKYTCSCVNNKKTTIKDFIDEIYENIFTLSSGSLLSSSQNIYNKIENIKGLFCEQSYRNKNEGFCKTCLLNLCQDCINGHQKEHEIIKYKDIEIDISRLDKEMKKIQENNLNDISCKEIETVIVKQKSNSSLECINKEDIKKFNQLINIILNNFKIFPNYIHFFNIRNIMNFLFKLEDESETNEIKYNNELSENDIITIEYKNNINNKTKLFNKTFVDNNKEKMNMEIEGEILQLNKEHIFNSNKNYVIIKLIIKKDVNEIDMYKMFANCQNLISINGISQWKKTKIINISKMFFNCVSLSYIPDINDWDISKVNDDFLIYFNCYSLIFLTNLENINKFNKKINSYLEGISLTKYFDINNDITIKNMIAYNFCINFLGYKFIIKNKNIEIVLFNGNQNEFIACYKKEEVNEKGKEINIFYKNEIKGKKKETEIEIDIIIKIININANIVDIIYSSILDFSKFNTIYVKNMSHMFDKFEYLNYLPDISNWNTDNVTDMSYMFSGCNHLISLPDLSKWNTNNVINMSNMFEYCFLLKSLPDISKWNTNKVVDMNSMFNLCFSLLILPDISKWNTNNVRDMKIMFSSCEKLKYLPDISNWNTNNVTNMSSMFNSCSSLTHLPDLSKWNTNKVVTMEWMFRSCYSLMSLPDISKWNTNNVTNMNSMFYGCTSLLVLPDISKWNISNVTDMGQMFDNCSSIKFLPDISKWNTSNVTSMYRLFNCCKLLSSLPDISKWNISNVKNISDIFSNCHSLSSLPKISNWNTSNVMLMDDLFRDCTSLTYLPDLSKWKINKDKVMVEKFHNCLSLLSIPNIEKENIHIVKKKKNAKKKNTKKKKMKKK